MVRIMDVLCYILQFFFLLFSTFCILLYFIRVFCYIYGCMLMTCYVTHDEKKRFFLQKHKCNKTIQDHKMIFQNRAPIKILNKENKKTPKIITQCKLHSCAVTTLMRMHVIDIPYITLCIRGKHIRRYVTSPRYSLQRGVSQCEGGGGSTFFL